MCLCVCKCTQSMSGSVQAFLQGLLHLGATGQYCVWHDRVETEFWAIHASMCTDDLLLLLCCVEQRVPRKSTLIAAYVILQTQSLLDVCHERAKGLDGLWCAVTTDPRNISTDSNDVNIEMKCQIATSISFQLWGAGLLQQQCKSAYMIGIVLCTLAARDKRWHCPVSTLCIWHDALRLKSCSLGWCKINP